MQLEVALTRSINWLLGLDGAAGALDELVRRNDIEPGPNRFWLNEVFAGDGGRTDLEYWWGDPAQTRVVVEAKIGHILTVDQVAGYRGRLGPDGGLLVILVPEARREEARRVAAECRHRFQGEPVLLDVWTYDEVTAALDAHLPGSSDVAQFKGLVRASGALDIFPMSPAELLDDDPTRREDIWRVIDEASFALFGKKLPSGTDASLANRRYVEIEPYPACFAEGAGRSTRLKEGLAQPWAWLRLGPGDSLSHVSQPIIEQHRPGQTQEDQHGLWLPLSLPPHVSGAVMIATVREELEAIAAAIRDAIDQALRAEATPQPADWSDSIVKVVGMAPIAPADLLDDSTVLKGDIDLVVREAARGFFTGKVNRTVSDAEFASNRYIRVTPFDTHIAISVGLKSRPLGEGACRCWPIMTASRGRTPQCGVHRLDLVPPWCRRHQLGPTGRYSGPRGLHEGGQDRHRSLPPLQRHVVHPRHRGRPMGPARRHPGTRLLHRCRPCTTRSSPPIHRPMVHQEHRYDPLRRPPHIPLG